MSKKYRKSAKSFVAKLLQDSEIRIHFDVERTRTELAAAIRAGRKRAGLTQAQLAKKIQSSQSVIARLEGGGDQRMPSLPLLAKIAKACDGTLELRLKFSEAA